MLEYAQLVKDEALRNEMVGKIMEEHLEGSQQIADLLGVNIEIRRKTMLYNERSRRSPLHALHKMQIEKLIEWRDLKLTNPEKAEQLLIQLLMITSALSGGLKSTG